MGNKQQAQTKKGGGTSRAASRRTRQSTSSLEELGDDIDNHHDDELESSKRNLFAITEITPPVAGHDTRSRRRNIRSNKKDDEPIGTDDDDDKDDDDEPEKEHDRACDKKRNSNNTSTKQATGKGGRSGNSKKKESPVPKGGGSKANGKPRAGGKNKKHDPSDTSNTATSSPSDSSSLSFNTRSEQQQQQQQQQQQPVKKESKKKIGIKRKIAVIGGSGERTAALAKSRRLGGDSEKYHHPALLQALHTDKTLHDYSLEGCDGVIVTAHSVVLRVSSGYFDNLLAGRGNSVKKSHNFTKFSELDGATLATVVEYMHTSRLTLSSSSSNNDSSNNSSSSLTAQLRQLDTLREASILLGMEQMEEAIRQELPKLVQSALQQARDAADGPAWTKLVVQLRGFSFLDTHLALLDEVASFLDEFPQFATLALDVGLAQDWNELVNEALSCIRKKNTACLQQSSDSLATLSRAAVECILKDEKDSPLEEMDRFDFLCAWAKASPADDRMTVASELTEHIRLTLIPPDKLESIADTNLVDESRLNRAYRACAVAMYSKAMNGDSSFETRRRGERSMHV